MSATAAAKAAVHAAKNVSRWGPFPALRYAIKHGATLGQFDQAIEFEERRARRERIRNDFAGYLA